MDYLPPGRVVKVGDKRFPRWVVKDAENRYWAGEGRWTDEPSGALLFHQELDAAKQKNRFCLGDDDADTFTATVVVTVHPGAGRRRSLPISWRATGSFSGAGLPARKDCCWRSCPTL